MLRRFHPGRRQPQIVLIHLKNAAADVDVISPGVTLHPSSLTAIPNAVQVAFRSLKAQHQQVTLQQVQFQN